MLNNSSSGLSLHPSGEQSSHDSYSPRSLIDPQGRQRDLKLLGPAVVRGGDNTRQSYHFGQMIMNVCDECIRTDEL